MTRQFYLLRLGCVFAAIAVVFALLLRHLFTVQVLRHEELLAKARETYTATRLQTGARGPICDRHGNVLAGNQACVDVLAEPRRTPRDRHAYVVTCLSTRLAVPHDLLTRRFESGAVEIVVARGVELQVARQVEELKLPGVRFVERTRRFYPKGDLLANVLGFTDADNKGVYGLEGTLEDTLKPRVGRVVFERDRKGRTISRDAPAAPTAHLDGRTVYLTIDEPIQSIVETELAAMVAEHAPRYAYAIMADPHTGAVLAMAQNPTFNANERDTMDPRAWGNHMVSDVYDPGSTMKAVAVTGALDYGIVSLASIFDCEMGVWWYCNRALHDSGHKYGRLCVTEIIQHSSNIGTAKIALEMGPARLYQTFRRFGFGEPTGLGLPSESRGLLRPPKRWDGLSITRFPIGQGVSVTPLQMVQAYSAIANGGQMMQLRLLDRVVEPGTGEVRPNLPQVRRLVARPPAIQQMVFALSQVTKAEGTAPKAAVPGYDVAGKTGTSQKLVNGSFEGHSKYVSSFIGFVPAQHPAFVLMVVADEPSNGKYYGGTVAAPVFRRIAEQTLRYLNVPPTVPLPAPPVKEATGRGTVRTARL